MLLTSAGRPVYQAGRFPAEMEDATAAAKEDGLAKAADWDSAGMAVARTLRTLKPTESVGTSCARAPEADSARTAVTVWKCIVSCRIPLLRVGNWSECGEW